MNRAAVNMFSNCIARDLRALWFHVRGFVRSIFQARQK